MLTSRIISSDNNSFNFTNFLGASSEEDQKPSEPSVQEQTVHNPESDANPPEKIGTLIETGFAEAKVTNAVLLDSIRQTKERIEECREFAKIELSVGPLMLPKSEQLVRAYFGGAQLAGFDYVLISLNVCPGPVWETFILNDLRVMAWEKMKTAVLNINVEPFWFFCKY